MKRLELLLNKRSLVSTGALVFCVSALLCAVRLLRCQEAVPYFYSSDYYGWIELGGNIFNHLDFTVNWELGSPLQYPPFFSIFIYLVSLITGNFVASIRYINIFGLSFCLSPLFCLVKNALNVPSAILAVVFTAGCFGEGCIFFLYADYFYSALVIVVCWFVLDILIHRSSDRNSYMLAGFLMSVVYLTKYGAIFFFFSSVASIFYYFRRCQHGMKTALRMSGFFLLGAAPLLIASQLLFCDPAKGKVPSIAAYTFFDGNYLYERKRDIEMKKLNPEGTDFSHLSLVRSSTPLQFSWEHPAFVLSKYLWGLKENVVGMSIYISPKAMGISENAAMIFQGVFFFLLVLTGVWFKWDFKMVHILFFAAGTIFTPIFHVDRRYLMPFVPLYFILWLYILNAAYRFASLFIKNKRGMSFLAGAVIICLGWAFCTRSAVFALRPRETTARLNMQNGKWQETARWIKNDARTFPGRVTVMANNNYLAYLTGSSFIYLPFESNMFRLVKFAISKKVDYLVLDKGSLSNLGFSQSEFRGSVTPEALIGAIKEKGDIHVPVASSAEGSLNRLLESEDLYKKMSLRPEESKDAIHRLEGGSRLSLSEIVELNSILLESNFPGKTPVWRWWRRIKYPAYELKAGNDTIVIFKLQREKA